MAGKRHILIVEDDPVSLDLLAGYFEKAGYQVSQAEDGVGMRGVLSRGGIDLVLLDINLPGDDGLTLVQEIRVHSEIGIILVTARKNEVDRILGLELGADDYVTKPFNERELLARVKNLLRRTSEKRKPQTSHQFNGWSLDMEQRRLTRANGENIPLTNGEFRLLSAFVRRPGKVFTRDQLLDEVSGRDWAPNDRTIDVVVSRLRRKMEEDPSRPRMFITVHGVGYQFITGVGEEDP